MYCKVQGQINFPLWRQLKVSMLAHRVDRCNLSGLANVDVVPIKDVTGSAEDGLGNGLWDPAFSGK